MKEDNPDQKNIKGDNSRGQIFVQDNGIHCDKTHSSSYICSQKNAICLGRTLVL